MVGRTSTSVRRSLPLIFLYCGTTVLVLLLPSLTAQGENILSCPAITRHPTEHSTYTPDFSGTVNFTLWQVFCVTNTNSSEGNFSSSWVVTDPHPPKAKNDTNLLDCEYTVDHCPVCRNASITLYNATDYDWGNYMVTISSECGSFNTSTFEVRFAHCNGSPPEPTTPNRTLVLHHHDKCHELSVEFKGDLDQDHYDIRWTNATGHLLCADDVPSPGSKYICNRTYSISDPCTFTSHLWICSFGQNDFGVYCARSYPVIGNENYVNQSCMTLRTVSTDANRIIKIAVPIAIVFVVVIIVIVIGVSTYWYCKKRKDRHGERSPLLSHDGSREEHTVDTVGYQSTRSTEVTTSSEAAATESVVRSPNQESGSGVLQSGSQEESTAHEEEQSEEDSMECDGPVHAAATESVVRSPNQQSGSGVLQSGSREQSTAHEEEQSEEDSVERDGPIHGNHNRTYELQSLIDGAGGKLPSCDTASTPPQRIGGKDPVIRVGALKGSVQFNACHSVSNVTIHIHNGVQGASSVATSQPARDHTTSQPATNHDIEVDGPQKHTKSAVTRTCLQESDLMIVFGILQNVAWKWRQIGGYLGFEQGKLQNIQCSPRLHGQEDFFSEMLIQWLRRSSPTVEALAEALRKVDEGAHAMNLERKFQRPPSCTPQNLTVRASDARTLNLSWKEPNKQNASITAYAIEVTEVTTGASAVFEQCTVQLKVQGLHPGYPYRCCVAVKNSFGCGPFTDATQITMPEDVPASAPLSVRMGALSPTTAELSWTPPLLHDCNGTIQNYRINITEASGSTQFQWSSTKTEYHLDSLQPDTTYHCSVAAATVVGAGPYSPLCTFRTPKDEKQQLRLKFEEQYSDSRAERKPLLDDFSGAEIDSPWKKGGIVKVFSTMVGEQTEVEVDSQCSWRGKSKTVESILANCVEECEITDPELVTIAQQIDCDYIERLAIVLLGSKKRFRDVEYERKSKGDYNLVNLCTAVLIAWKDNTEPQAMRQQLVRVLCRVQCVQLAEAVAMSRYS